MNPWVKVRQSAVHAHEDLISDLAATIAERDAELTKLRAFVALAASTCGMNNCNCPTAPKIRQALKELLENSPE